ncbi:hypothetical protein DAI21_18035 [Lelliottia sp. WB101]|uniref:hypothetical protein n=1 Tax=Lelliottia sp. WB101 TaxID=2153385 RepID=UPI000D229F9B|nr:hypothetical protein [Lelliottia sp. WB101]AVY99414.1 hypothetical protein DAI21_18035 [Lelliottia sp. WB101]
MGIKIVDSCIIAIADVIFEECGKIPAHVTPAECKNKRNLRKQLYRLAEMASLVGCSEECSFWLGKRITAWLATGDISEGLTKRFAFADFAQEPGLEYFDSSNVEVESEVEATLFRRRYYYQDAEVASIIYSIESDYHSELIAAALEKIPAGESKAFESRIEEEKAISFNDLYQEFSRQLREKQTGKVDWSAIDFAVSVLFDDSENMHERSLDRKLPIKEALAKHVAYRIKTLVLTRDQI